MLTTRHGVRPLGAGDLDDFLALARQDPVVNVFVDYRARTTNLEPRWLGGEMWGRFEGGRLRAACHVGANLVPVQATAEDAAAFAERALTRGRTVSTIVGPQEAVEVFWEGVAAQLGHARATPAGTSRTCRSTARPPSRPTRWCAAPPARTWPSCTRRAWPCTPRRSASRRRPAGEPSSTAPGSRQLMNRGWSFARFDDGRLVFKAEVACATPYAAQVQGVWVAPDRRGEGLAAAGMAAVVELVRAEIAPIVSLYVNDWNDAARRTYEQGRVPRDRALRHRHVLRSHAESDWTIPVRGVSCLCGRHEQLLGPTESPLEPWPSRSPPSGQPPSAVPPPAWRRPRAPRRGP